MAMYICICKAVTDRQIRQAAEAGISNIKGLCMATQAGTCCGKCLPEARRVLQEAVAESCMPMRAINVLGQVA